VSVHIFIIGILYLQYTITMINYEFFIISTIFLSLFNNIIVMSCTRTELFSVYDSDAHCTCAQVMQVRDRCSRSVLYFERTRITPLQTSFGNIWYIFQNLLFIIIVLHARIGKKKYSLKNESRTTPDRYAIIYGVEPKSYRHYIANMF